MKINASAFLPLTNKQRESAFTIWFPFLHVEHFLHAEHQVPHGLESQFIPPSPQHFVKIIAFHYFCPMENVAQILLLKSCHSVLFVVYFDQQTGAPHIICWSKSIFSITMETK